MDCGEPESSRTHAARSRCGLPACSQIWGDRQQIRTARDPQTHKAVGTRSRVRREKRRRGEAKGWAALRVPSRSHWARRRVGRTLLPVARARRCRVRRGLRPTPTAPCRCCEQARGVAGEISWQERSRLPGRGGRVETKRRKKNEMALFRCVAPRGDGGLMEVGAGAYAAARALRGQPRLSVLLPPGGSDTCNLAVWSHHSVRVEKACGETARAPSSTSLLFTGSVNFDNGACL